MALETVVVALLLVGASSKFIPSFAGPYVLYVERVLGCGENDSDWRERYGTIKTSHFNPAKPREKQILTGAMKLLMDLNDTYRVSMLVHKRANNQWKKNYFVFDHFPVGACSSLRANIPGVFATAFKPNLTGHCNVPKGTYTFNNIPCDWQLPNFPHLPYGHYFIRLKCERKFSRITVCSEVVVIPKA